MEFEFNIVESNFLVPQNYTIYDAKRSSKWSDLRNEWLINQNYCRACGCSKVNLLNVHHILPFHLYPEFELNRGNLVTLCEKNSCNCHFVFGHCMDWRSYNPTVVKDVKIILKRIMGRKYTR